MTISSHNVNGFSHSKSFLYSLCDKFPHAIRGIQEHWLAPPYKKHLGVNRLRSFHPLFDGFGNSAMKKQNESKIRMGRPFGGTGFLYPKKFSQELKPLVQYKHERVSVLQMTAKEADILLISAYLPFFNTRDLQNYVSLYQDTLAYIEMIMHENQTSKFIILLDMNCNIYDASHTYSKLMIDFMARNSLLNTFNLIPNFDSTKSFTRCDEKTNSYTLIDGILVTESLSNLISNVRISEYGDNVSDHRPVEMELSVTLSTIDVPVKKQAPSVIWHKLDSTTLESFRHSMTAKLNDIDVPFHSILHGDQCCADYEHRHSIQQYYEEIVAAVEFADKTLPRCYSSIKKPFWSNELNQLKQQSIECFRVWKEHGSPISGPFFECKRRCSKVYKTAIRAAKKKSETELNEQMFDDLASKNTDDFWKALRSKTKENSSLVTRW